MRIINKKTVLIFNSTNEKNTAVDYLLKLNVPFNTVNKKPVVVISARLYIKHCLDLVLNAAGQFSTFKYANPINH